MKFKEYRIINTKFLKLRGFCKLEEHEGVVEGDIDDE